jgi:hypothetical protein
MPESPATAMRPMSAVQGTFVVARKKTSQVTMLEVVVGPHFGLSPNPLTLTSSRTEIHLLPV